MAQFMGRAPRGSGQFQIPKNSMLLSHLRALYLILYNEKVEKYKVFNKSLPKTSW